MAHSYTKISTLAELLDIHERAQARYDEIKALIWSQGAVKHHLAVEFADLKAKLESLKTEIEKRSE